LGGGFDQRMADNSMIMSERLLFRWAPRIHMLALRGGELALAGEGKFQLRPGCHDLLVLMP
jgi:hypothetical protein